MRGKTTLSLLLLAASGCAQAVNDDARTSCGAQCTDATDASDGATGDEVGDDSALDSSTGDSSTDDSSRVDLDGTTASDSSSPLDSGGAIDSSPFDGGKPDTATVDSGHAGDTAPLDTGTVIVDTGTTPDTSTGGIIGGGPCSSGASGGTAFRIKFVNGGGTATVRYEVDGLPDKSRWKAGAYGYSIGFTPSFVNPYLGEGGLQLDGSDFVDVEISTKGISSIRSATLAIYGRSYDTTTSGSFNWRTFTDVGATPTDFVSNVAPYAWYGYDATSAFTPGDGGVLLRIKAGPSSGSLVVNKIELCMDAT